MYIYMYIMYIYIYYIYIIITLCNAIMKNNVPLLVHKAIVVITGRAHCFYDCIYITPILRL